MKRSINVPERGRQPYTNHQRWLLHMSHIDMCGLDKCLTSRVSQGTYVPLNMWFNFYICLKVWMSYSSPPLYGSLIHMSQRHVPPHHRVVVRHVPQINLFPVSRPREGYSPLAVGLGWTCAPGQPILSCEARYHYMCLNGHMSQSPGCHTLHHHGGLDKCPTSPCAWGVLSTFQNKFFSVERPR